MFFYDDEGKPLFHYVFQDRLIKVVIGNELYSEIESGFYTSSKEV